MSPFYERETGRELKRGEVFEMRNKGPVPPTKVEIWSDDQALVTPPERRSVFIGEIDSKMKGFKSGYTQVSGRVLLTRESASTNVRGTDGVVWKKDR